MSALYIIVVFLILWYNLHKRIAVHKVLEKYRRYNAQDKTTKRLRRRI